MYIHAVASWQWVGKGNRNSKRMALNDRLDYEEGKMEATDLFMKYCSHCRYYTNLFRPTYHYCHKCINNPKINIHHAAGLVVEDLFDYFKPAIREKRESYHEESHFPG